MLLGHGLDAEEKEMVQIKGPLYLVAIACDCRTYLIIENIPVIIIVNQV